MRDKFLIPFCKYIISSKNCTLSNLWMTKSFTFQVVTASIYHMCNCFKSLSLPPVQDWK